MTIPIKMKSQFAVCINEQSDYYLSNVKCLNIFIKDNNFRVIIQSRTQFIDNIKSDSHICNQEMSIKYMTSQPLLRSFMSQDEIKLEDLKFI